MKIVRRLKDKHRCMQVYEYQNQNYVSRADMRCSFSYIFKYQKLPNGRYYTLVDDIEPTIQKHIDRKVKRWLDSIKTRHKEKLEKWFSIITKAGHFQRLQILTKTLKKDATFIGGIRKLRRKARDVIDLNWACGDCGWRMTRKFYYESCSCHICEDWPLSSSGRDHGPTKRVSYFCEVCEKERSVPEHLKLCTMYRLWKLPYTCTNIEDDAH